jgi:hypothetical protein
MSGTIPVQGTLVTNGPFPVINGDAVIGVRTNATRPAAASVAPGFIIANTDTGTLQWSDGSVWHDPTISASGSRTVEEALPSGTTTVATYTPATTLGLWIGVYYRVVTAPTNVTITVTYTDPTGSQTATVLPITMQPVGSYVQVPLFILSTNAAVSVTFTCGTASQVLASASIVEA